MGFILSELQSGKVTLSETVRKAKAMGYTEPDPRDDLSGTDVVRKALIMARCLGMNMDLNDVEVEPLYPASMQTLTVDEFMRNLDGLDEEMEQRIVTATNNDKRLRYAATVSSKGAKVGLVEVDKDNSLYHLVGTDNSVAITSEWYQSPLCISGPGAGIDVTAAGVLSDVCELRNLQLQRR